ncbi:hypothetical protein [Photobacterium leiognathi]|uniref:hypothetical protein n=1 Tax=Photobacterium leiognathi TaxID=553611 RepID=UPI0027387853|nr:hypothetical protein [Photobacterium leiognathi]
MADQSDRGKETLIRLEQALQRLVDGNPIKTKPDGRISLKRINDEAGLSSGGIYYYSSFVEMAKKTIQLRRQQDSTGKTKVNNERLNKLREQREKREKEEGFKGKI